jgi:oligoribonuclease
MVDVSSIKELARRWYPRAYFASPQKHGGHRALADIRESIRELRYYREAIFVPPPGPDTTTARGIAARYGAAGTAPGQGSEAGPGSEAGQGTVSDPGREVGSTGESGSDR